jgi:hypothetical protein
LRGWRRWWVGFQVCMWLLKICVNLCTACFLCGFEIAIGLSRFGRSWSFFDLLLFLLSFLVVVHYCASSTQRVGRRVNKILNKKISTTL